MCGGVRERANRPAPDPEAPNGAPPPAVIETPIPAWALTEMPSGGGLYSLIETMQPTAISNRIEGGGIYAGMPAHIGAHGGTWTQTLFRVGDINITDPDGSGTPLALPGVLEWDHVDVNTGILEVDANAPGMVVNLNPRRPSSTWVRQVEALIGPPTFQAGRDGTTPPAIARLDSYANGRVLLSGPLRERLGIVFAGTYTHATRHERASTTALRGAMGSAFAHLVERWGPGTGGNPSFSSVDPRLHRPFMDEMVFGFEYRPTPVRVTSLAGVARRDKRLLVLTDPGVAFSAYSKSVVIDPGVDVAGGTTTQPLPVYNRPTSTFGADRYLLTNNPDAHAFFTGVDATAQLTLERLYLLIGGTAGRSEGWASNVGFRHNENDNAVLGEVFVDPNANPFATGRPFTERGYTLHASGVYRFAHDIRLGVAARYQDGQHFSRLVVASDLNQGPELVRAFANGETRFTFTCTIDARLQKGLEVSGHHVDAIVDVFDLLNLGLEVEEVTVTGPTSRRTSAIQPPRALHIGVRVGF